MKLLWICGLPFQVQAEALANEDHGAVAAWSWIIAHLPPPPDIELHVACLWPGGTSLKTFQHFGVTWHLVPTDQKHRSITLFRNDRKVMRKLSNNINPDIIHGWGTEDSHGLLAYLLSPANHVISVQGLVKEYRRVVGKSMDKRSIITQQIESFTLGRAMKVTVESSYSERISKPLVKKGRIWKIDHPLRQEFLTTRISDGSKNEIVVVGSLDDRKGIDDAIAAFAGLKDNDWKLTIIGSGPKHYTDYLNSLAARLNVSDKVTFIDKATSDEIIEHYVSSSIFLLPTKIDTGPTALKEAIAMGVWPLCYDNSGPAGYIRDFQYGTLAKDGDVHDLTLKLQECVESRSWEKISNRKEVINNIRQSFDKNLIWKNLISIYQY